MRLPFTKEQFIGVFEAYNAAMEPAQLIFYALGFLCALILAAPMFPASRLRAAAARSVWVVLGFFWIWDGALYHIAFFSAINPAARIFGALFILQGVLFLAVAFAKKAGPTKLRRDWIGIGGYALIAYALIGYPLVGAAAGHAYPAAPVFGVAPCPTVIFTFGVLLVSGRAKLLLAAVPLLWALIGGSAAFFLGIPEDLGLPAAGAFALAALFLERRSGLTPRASATIQ